MRQTGRLASCDHKGVGHIENGSQVPGIDIVEKLAAGLGLPPGWLAFGNEADLPFRQKQIALKYDEPEPQPGIGLFRARYETCGERLRQAREQSGHSLRAIAEAAGVSFQAVQYTESGLTAPRVDTIEAIAVALDVPPGWLAYGEEPEV